MDYKNLIHSCNKGNQISQRKLFEIFAPKMLGVCMRYFTSKQEAEDILQEGFIKVYTNLHNYNFKGSFEGWIRRIMVNTALDTIRKNMKYRDDVELNSVDFKVTAEAHIVENISKDELLVLIHELPPGYRAVFNLFAIEGYSHKEIAAMLEISENTSKSQFSRAKNLLRKKLEDVGIER